MRGRWKGRQGPGPGARSRTCSGTPVLRIIYWGGGGIHTCSPRFSLRHSAASCRGVKRIPAFCARVQFSSRLASVMWIRIRFSPGSGFWNTDLDGAIIESLIAL